MSEYTQKKKRREELRRFADQWEAAVLACGLAPDMDPAELRALLDADERLEKMAALINGLDAHFADMTRVGRIEAATWEKVREMLAQGSGDAQ